MSIYIILVIITLLTSGEYRYGGRSISSNVSIITMIFLVVISALRFDVGFDYPSYYGLVYPNIDEFELERLEPASQIIVRITAYLGNPQLLFIIFAIITYTAIFSTIWKYSNNVGISCIIYLSLLYLNSLGTIRQASAVAIVFFCVRFIYNKQLIKYCIGIFIATMFHLSAILAIIIYPLINWLNYKWMTIVVILVSLSAFLSLNILLSNSDLAQYHHYLGLADELKGGNLIKYFYLSLGIIMTITSYHFHEYNAMKLALLGLLGACFPFLIGGHLGTRLAEYFIVFYCLSIPKVLSHFPYMYRQLTLIGFGLYFLLTIKISMNNPTKTIYTPYQTVYSDNAKLKKFK